MSYKIFDCFTFFNEVDLLEFRLKLLSEYVDYFVIVESNLTHSGQPKPYHFEENKERFAAWKNKIIYITLDQTTDGLQFTNCESYSPENGSWKLENEQRNGISYIKEMVENNDIVLIGDLDEIPDPGVVYMMKHTEADWRSDAVSLQMLFHYYYMNCQNEGFERWWNGTVVCKGYIFKVAQPQVLRDRRNDYPAIAEAGWHFSYLGGIEKIRTKIESFAHTEFNRSDITSDENIINAIENGEDIFRRPGVNYKFHPLEEYPEYLQKLMKQYPQFIKEV